MAAAAAAAASAVTVANTQSSLVSINRPVSFFSSTTYRPPSARISRSSPLISVHSASSLPRPRGLFFAAVAASEAVSRPLGTDPIPPGEYIKLGEEIGGGGGEGTAGRGGGGGGGGGGGDGSGSGGGDQEDGDGEDQEKSKKMTGMSMSQKLTLGYAALVAVGGVMGCVKSRSQKSLAAGGTSAMVLYYVYTQLPVRPAFASSLGLGISAVLLVVMGSRFKKSKKIFPAGVVSVVSFVMVGGYFHGILRGLHA